MTSTILIVERDHSVRKTVAHMVWMAGFSAVGTSRTDAAFYALRAVQVDCMITLTKPPDQSVESFISAAKRIRPLLPIVLSREITLMASYRGLIAGYLGLPFYVCDLKNVLEGALSDANV